MQVWFIWGWFATCKFPAHAEFSELGHMIRVWTFVVTMRDFFIASAAVVITPYVDDVFMLPKCVFANIYDAGPEHIRRWNGTRGPD